jgi:hypothetical protein
MLCAGHDQKIVLMAGDTLRVQSSAANSIDAMASGVLNDFGGAAAVPSVVVGTNATISVAPANTQTADGEEMTWLVQTDLPAGTVLYWENIGTTGPEDFTDDRNSGTVTVGAGPFGTLFTRTLRSNIPGVDRVGEGNETIIMVIGTVPRYLGGGVLAVAAAVTVLDNPVTSGLILHVDAGRGTSTTGPSGGPTWFDISGSGNNVILQNSPTWVNGTFQFNGTNQWARTAGNLNLTAFDSVTVEIVVRSTASTGGMFWEHTADWNTNTGGIGLAPHSNGNSNVVNSFHTNHNTGPARNYLSSLNNNWAVHTNIYSRIGDPTGRLTYVNGQPVVFDTGPGYPTSTATTGGSFANSIIYFASRGGTTSFCPCQIMMFRVYNRKLNDSEIFQNYQAIQGRLV